MIPDDDQIRALVARPGERFSPTRPVSRLMCGAHSTKTPSRDWSLGYASEPFEVHVVFAERDGHTYPVIAIQQGVRVPVVVKNALADACGNKLLSVGEVYSEH